MVRDGAAVLALLLVAFAIVGLAFALSPTVNRWIDRVLEDDGTLYRESDR